LNYLTEKHIRMNYVLEAQILKMETVHELSIFQLGDDQVITKQKIEEEEKIWVYFIYSFT